MLARLGPWPFRVLWLVLPVAAGATLARGLDEASTGVRTASSVGLWAGWALVLLASLVPLPSTLTALRVAAPLAPVAVGWAALAAEPEAVDALALAVATLAAVAAFSADLGDVFVDGASYGTERRFALRPPGPLLLGPVELTWVAAVVGALAGPLLLADGRWLPGALACLVGLPVAVLSVRAMHGLARRWIVFVPAGFVVHDALALQEPVLVPRGRISHLGPARVGTAATDLTRGAWGLALEAAVDEPLTLALAGRGAAELLETDALLFTPSRPGSLLTVARDRRLPVG